MFVFVSLKLSCFPTHNDPQKKHKLVVLAKRRRALLIAQFHDLPMFPYRSDLSMNGVSPKLVVSLR